MTITLLVLLLEGVLVFRPITRLIADQLSMLRLGEERTRMTLNTSLDAIVGIDSRGLINSWNPQAEAVFGWSEKEAIGRRLSETIMPPQYRGAHEKGFKNFLATGEGPVLNQRIEIEALRRNGEEFPVELSIAPLRTGDGFCFSAFIRDISERKRTAAELKEAKEAAEASSEAKSIFLANMSHEIRTPMNAVIGMTGLLLDTELDQEQAEYTENVRNSGEALLTVINDILDFSKIESGKLEIEVQPFELRGCVEESLDLVASRAAEKDVDLAYVPDDSVPDAVVGDISRLRQILVNLLSNAVKFTETGEVVVTAKAVSCHGPDGDEEIENRNSDSVEAEDLHPAGGGGPCHEIHFSVRDTGIGIPANRLGALFESFSQADISTTRRFGGTGLGLSISLRLSEMMGGRMWVESEEGCGSTFHFTIKAEISPSEPPAYLCGSRPGLSGKRLLVVDDNETSRKILTRWALTWGMLPTAAGSGAEALERLEGGETYDIAIVDMRMPVMSGVELARSIQDSPRTREMPLIMLSSLGRRSKGAGEVKFADFLTKPIKPSQLFDVLSSVAGRQDRDPRPRTPAITFDPGLAARLQLRILLAEDNVVNQKVAVGILRKMGFRPEVAANGLEVIEALERQSFDVILMDVQMPEMDGLEATRTICRRWPPGVRPQIIAMTAGAMRGDREECLAAGMGDYISKPVRVEELAAALERCARQKNDRSEAPPVRATVAPLPPSRSC